VDSVALPTGGSRPRRTTTKPYPALMPHCPASRPAAVRCRPPGRHYARCRRFAGCSALRRPRAEGRRPPARAALRLEHPRPGRETTPLVRHESGSARSLWRRPPSRLPRRAAAPARAARRAPGATHVMQVVASEQRQDVGDAVQRLSAGPAAGTRSTTAQHRHCRP